MPLDTLSNVKQALSVSGTDDDALIGQLQLAADAFIAQHCGRVFVGGTFTEYHSGGSSLIFLQNFPVATVESLKVDVLGDFGSDTLRDAGTYRIHTDRGVIENLAGPFVYPRAGFRNRVDDYPRAIQVIYTTATGSVPADIGQAYSDLIGHWYREAKSHEAMGQLDLLQQTDGSTVVQYPWGLSGGFPIPKGVMQLLNGYRVPAI